MRPICKEMHIARSNGVEQTCQEILDAAFRPFAAHGYAGTSTQIIVEAAGLSNMQGQKI